ncbi:hypothetical protein N5853_10190 [Bartonella sp. HY329]|uniref:endonuclease/exonuclease/phosphatase family protein n=1 Tax=unclassified Bartonella TaxID=2645622 RepID=UPI0021C85B26|nr:MULTISPECIES: endonuclease/exonuclease/phosphatase family protein [unclassified Bartonella]UXM94470.1 hypothetical protein N5853_10190 [Bartonella sp. HY329]UXN08794.1 hypothetical protein N5852_10200 [Bartonella sp. HY328]
MQNNNKPGVFSFIWLLLLIAATVPLLISYLGALHPMLDSVAHFRRHMAFVLIVATIPLFFTSFKRFGLAIIAFSLFCVLSTYQTQGLKPTSISGTRHFKLIQTNLRYDNPHSQKLIDLLNSEKPDFVTYQEASGHWQKALSEFAQTNNYYTFKCERAQRSTIGATGFLSIYPFVNTMPEAACPNDAGIATAMVDIGAKTPLKLSSLHLFWPWPHQQKSQIIALPLTKEPLQLIGGDFNATSWSYAVKFIEDNTATRHVNGIASSWLSYSLPDSIRPILGLPIDQILLSDEFKLNKVEQLPSIGSDHLPMKVEFSL